jgi:hypothetical protein
LNGDRRLPWIGVRFDCCRVYARFYRAKGDDRYHVACPKCRRRTEVLVGPKGSDTRFFVVR